MDNLKVPKGGPFQIITLYLKIKTPPPPQLPQILAPIARSHD